MDGQNQAAAPAAVALPSVPSSWPGGFGVYKHSKKAVLLNLETLLVLWVAIVVLDVLANLILKQNPVGEAILFILLAPITAANTLTVIAGVRGQKLAVGDAVNKAVSLWLKMIVMFVIMGLIMVVSILLLVIPFFFVMPRVLLSYYFLVDKDMGITDSVKASWEITKGNVGKIYGIIGVNIAMVLLMVTIIGIPFSLYFLLMYAAAYAVLYEFLGKTRPATATAAAPKTPVAPEAPQTPPTPAA